jgi:HK97 family phage portal protein
MNFLDTVQRWFRPTGRYQSNMLVDGNSNYSGVAVTEQTALGSSAVWACINLISQTVATLPFRHYLKTKDDNRIRLDSKLDFILNNEPTPDYSGFTFKEIMTAAAVLHGNAFAEISRDANGECNGLWYIPTQNVQPYFDTDTESIWYAIYAGDYRGSKPYMGIPARNMLHILGLSYDGLAGYSPLYLQRETFALHLASQRYGASFFKNGARPAGIIKFPNKLSPEAKDGLRRSWDSFHSGAGNTGRVAILEGGLDFQKLQLDPEEAQFLQTQRYSREEIASIFRVPPSLIGAADASDNIEAVSLQFLRSLQPWLCRWEQEISRKLIYNMAEYVEVDTKTILRTDIKTRYESMAIGRQWGWLSAGDCRKLENLNADVPGMEDYLKPMNMEKLDAAPAPVAELVPGGPAVTAPGVDTPDSALPSNDKPSNDKPSIGLNATAGADVASTALNGAQITSLVDLVTQVAQKLIPVDVAKAIAMASFPFLSIEVVNTIFNGLGDLPTPDLALPPNRSNNKILERVLTLKVQQLRAVEATALKRISKDKSFVAKLDELTEQTKKRHYMAFDEILEAFEIKGKEKIAEFIAHTAADNLKAKFLDVAGNTNFAGLPAAVESALPSYLNSNLLPSFTTEQ